MDLQSEKIELIELLLQSKKESVLKKIRKILENDKQMALTPEQYEIIDQRRVLHLNGISKSFSWNEVKQNARLSVK